jgi:hypothetical protein
MNFHAKVEYLLELAGKLAKYKHLLITKFSKLKTEEFYNIGPSGHEVLMKIDDKICFSE